MMNALIQERTLDRKSEGFTLIELVVVIAILGMLALVAVPRVAGITGKAHESVCEANLKTIERLYSALLVENNLDHEESLFNQFLSDHFDEVCPDGGIISYEDGEVKCSEHEGDVHDDEEDESGEEVPWL